MSILEAANSAKPVLLRDLDLYKDILWDWYLRREDVDGFCEEVRRLATDKDYYREASEKSGKIAEFYSKEHVASLWREYYPRIYEKWAKVKKLKR